jgi:hypothetical protein
MAALSPSDVPESAHGAGIGICVDVTGRTLSRPNGFSPGTSQPSDATGRSRHLLCPRLPRMPPRRQPPALLLAGAFLDSERARLNLAR